MLRLEFHDADPGHMNADKALGYKLFNDDHAAEVLKFLKKHEDDTYDVIVYCEAGISRSAAVSKFISIIYGLEFPENYSLYNKHVFSTLMRVHGEAYYGANALINPENLPSIKEI